MSEVFPVASSLADLAHALESGQDAEARVRRVLAQLRRIVPHERCAVLNAVTAAAPRLVIEPHLPDPERGRIAAKAEALLATVADRPGGGALLPAPGNGAPHLAVPLVSMDEIAGVLLVERDSRRYGDQDLQLLSVAGSALGAYFTTLRLQASQEEQAESLRHAERRRTHFLGVLSHELRNPLAPMGNALHILDRVEPASEPAARARAVIARQFGHLARLVNDLLDATRIASGKVHVQRSHLELSELVRRTVEDHRSLFVRAGVDLSVRLQEPLWVDGDPVRLSQVVSNLLANAAKFTNPGGKVEVSVRREPPATATVTVQDDGVGMAPEILARLFEPFAQGDETLDRSRGGLGLGLALAKGLVELHGGAIEAHSDGVGRGSTFTVHLPLAARDAASPDAGRAPATAPPRRILVVEDNVDAAETLRDLLRLSGHTVEIAHDGPAGIAGAAAFRPDLVLCDVGLPGMNGYEVARTIRATASGRTTTLVALTGYGSEDDRRRAFEAGFDGHLVKPVSAEQLQSVLLDLPRASPATRS